LIVISAELSLSVVTLAQNFFIVQHQSRIRVDAVNPARQCKWLSIPLGSEVIVASKH
jgi:hypothetical protein